ncbi:MAG: type II toxin-antitoxin system RelE/ParE family toxin [Pigmentiphaga sp.]
MQIEYKPQAIKDLKAITPSLRSRITAKIVQYATDPESLANQVKHLSGSTFYRLRVGDYRVIFDLNEEGVTIMVVVRVRHRREAYDQH